MSFQNFTFSKLFSETLMRISLSDETASDIRILFRQSFNSLFSLFRISSLVKVSIILFLLSSRYLKLQLYSSLRLLKGSLCKISRLELHS